MKNLNTESNLDFVRCLSLLSQYHCDGSEARIARSYKPRMENFYEEYVHSVVADSDGKFGKFSMVFPKKEFNSRFENLNVALKTLEIKNNFISIIDIDMYFFGLTYVILFLNKSVDFSRKDDLKAEVDAKIAELKSDTSHSRAPGNLGNLRTRIRASIDIFEKYAS